MQHLKNNYNINQQQLHHETPQVYRERPSVGSDLLLISPIPTLSQGSSDCNSLKSNERLQGRFQFLSGQQIAKLGVMQNHQNMSDQNTPNNLAQEFYKNHMTGKGEAENDFYFESFEHGEINSHNNRQFTDDNNKNQFINNQKTKQINQKMQQLQEGQSDFDMTAKEISSNKRFDKKLQKNTILSGRTSHSPIDGAQSNSETVKWAFTNKDSQETQKKVSVIGRDSVNTQDIISKSLKSHDSRTQLHQQTNSSQQMPNGLIKGKMLDFANIDKSQSGMYGSNRLKGTEISQFEGQQVISFLGNESDLLPSSNKKRMTAQNLYKQQIQKSLQLKYLPTLKHKINNDLMKSLVDNTIDCFFCNQQKIFDSSLNCSKLEGPKKYNEILKENLERKYLTSREYYNVKIINDIIYNESTHIVSVFKDYLIFDDISEFLKRYYHKLEGVQRLPKMFEFYEKYSKVFPNYVILPSNKYLFKNIEKKQRIIDEKQRYLQDQQERKQHPSNDFKLGNSGDKKNRHKDRFSSNHQNSSNLSYTSNNRMFDTHFINSVANINPSGFIESMQSSRINNSQFHDHMLNSSLLIQQQLHQNMENAKKKKKKALNELDFEELISKFIAKDSESNIQQSTIMLQSESKPSNNRNAPEKKRVYEYKVQGSSDNSKATDNLSSLTKQQQNVNIKDNKKMSAGSQDKAGSNNKQLVSQQEKIMSYNIYNNYNQYINNENYYINADKIQPNAINEQQQQKLTQQQPVSTKNNESRQGSLQRNQSKNNLHQNLPKQPTIDNNCQTPHKSGTSKKEVKTPSSGQRDLKKQSNNKAVKLQKEQQQQLVLNQQDDQVLQKQLLLQTNRSSNSLNRVSETQTQSPLNNYGQRGSKSGAFTTTLNTCRANTEAIVSREMSKEKKPHVQNLQNQKQYQNIAHAQQNNQMFKNDLLINLAQKIPTNEFGSTQEYNPISQQNIRTIERLHNIEEEIEKDYSKYVNDYGLTKTAFAKAVNHIREKQLKLHGPLQQNMIPAQSLPTTTRQARLSTNSNEKKRLSSNNGRSGSTSQQRKGSNTRQQNKNNNQQDNVNELYMHTNSVRSSDQQKQIRSFRTKGQLSSQNSSSCFQRSQKLSPDKQNFTNNMITSSITNLNQTPSNNFITLKASTQQSKQPKGIKIKLPQQQKENIYQVQQQNNSTNQTPKRIKLQKTKSTSNIPIQFAQKVLQQQSFGGNNGLLSTSRVRGGNGIPEVLIQDDLSQQLSITNCMLSSNLRPSTQMFDPHNQFQDQLYTQGTFTTNSCVGTYATTSILNSPLSYRHQQHSQVQQQQQRGQTNKSRQSSRNGTNSQHQSQKSLNANHERARSSNGFLQNSNSKNKSKNNESKRMSAGSNASKKLLSQNPHHQSSSSNNIQQQILQLLLSCQNQEGDMTSTSSLQPPHQQYPLFQNNLKGMTLNNTQSMKDLKSFTKQPTTTLLKDLGTIKATKQKLQQPQIPQTLNTQRQGQPSSIMMINQVYNQKKSSKSGKNTSRGGENSKKKILQQQNILMNPYSQNEISNNGYTSQYQQLQNTNNAELSSRLGQMLNHDSTSSLANIQSQLDHAKRILSYSKSQENLDLIKFAAQRAAIESQMQMQQQQQQQQQFQQQMQQQQNIPQSNKFLQNIKPTENTISLSKFKLMPSQSNQVLLSARNNPNENNQYRSNVSEYEVGMPCKGGPTNIIIGSNFDKPQSRRTSVKFYPSSTKNQLQ